MRFIVDSVSMAGSSGWGLQGRGVAFVSLCLRVAMFVNLLCVYVCACVCAKCERGERRSLGVEDTVSRPVPARPWHIR